MEPSKLLETYGMSIRDVSEITAKILMGKPLSKEVTGEEKTKLVLAAYVNNQCTCMAYVTAMLKKDEPDISLEIFETKLSPKGVVDYLIKNVNDTVWFEALISSKMTELMVSDHPMGKLMGMVMSMGGKS